MLRSYIIKDFKKSNDVMENYVIILGPLSLNRKIQKNHNNTCISIINGRSLTKYSTWVVHDNYIAHSKQNSSSCLTLLPTGWGA